MTELELQHLRREKWRLEGEPLRTSEDAREFVDSVGLCLMFPVRPMPLLPTFVAATIGSDQKLPTRKTAFSDERVRDSQGLLMRLIRDKSAFEGQLQGETLVLSPQVFPYYYTLASDRMPKQPLRSRERGKGSPLSEHVFCMLDESGPLTRAQLQQQLGGALSEAGLDRALQELWAALKITRIDHDAGRGDTWATYYHWAPDLVNEGVRMSDAQALSGLISKYLDGVIAATEEEIENVLSPIASRARVAEVVRAMLGAREFTYTPSETRTLITVQSPVSPAAARAEREATTRNFAPRRRNG